ncbi:SDR family NAD(P)-dependent oxidoreductase [Streptomyces sp. NPDC058534]|uniref:SDR family NAD(P)-dependent oxidoreductase n=1 Tax=Streptomyces sp. NPDC058534 TaxID=3346541 RepID=UPI00364DDF3C
MEIANSVVLITGGASGLGLATARRFVAAGCRVVIADVPASKGLAVAGELGERARFAPTDVTREDEVEAALDAAAELGQLRIVVNCAGVVNSIKTTGRKGPFPLDDFECVVRVNLIGTFNVIRLAAARMVESEETGGERGVIITTASVAAFDGQVGQAAYAASKGGVASMTLPVARDLAARKVRVACIAPGMFDTPMVAGLPPAALESLQAQTQHPARLGDPDEYAALAEHIVTNHMLNGEVIRLDGAMRMAPR